MQYNKLIKCLLGVRKNTSINLCMIESGIPPIQSIIAKQRRAFIQSKLNNVDLEQPFHIVYELCQRANTPGYRFLSTNREDISGNNDPLAGIKTLVRQKSINATKFATYLRDLNPHMTVHAVYQTSELIPDYKREGFTRLILMSHNLKIETGR